jgi:glutamine synthetase
LPDSSANPYLTTAVLIAAGLDGIDRKLDPGPDCTDDLFALPLAAIAARGVAMLPRDLSCALDALEADEVVCSALGPTLTVQFVALKREEWMEYSRHVSGWELERYAAAF